MSTFLARLCPSPALRLGYALAAGTGAGSRRTSPMVSASAIGERFSLAGLVLPSSRTTGRALRMLICLAAMLGLRIEYDHFVAQMFNPMMRGCARAWHVIIGALTHNAQSAHRRECNPNGSKGGTDPADGMRLSLATVANILHRLPVADTVRVKMGR